ncbi:MAG: 4-hydroxy-tetrahydrodipicolinate synthase [Paracoccaceae bacterium]|jgi:4-hydroxy-tetrahydrodipicolinate synthase
MLGNGVQGVTLFGTTGEGASIGLDERSHAIKAMIDSGISANVMTLGLCACAVTDVVAQVAQGLAFGVSQFLLLPPYYFTDLDDAGLFEWHAKLFELVDPRAKFVLYHIPQVTQVPLSVDLVMRLRSTFPDRVIAIKDSSGNWDNTKALIETGKIPVLVGDERLLHKAAAIGAAGSICGVANLYPQRMNTLFDSQTEDTDLSTDVDFIVSVPVIPALKQIMVAMTGDASWGNLRAPLQPLTSEASAKISARFSKGAAT